MQASTLQQESSPKLFTDAQKWKGFVDYLNHSDASQFIVLSDTNTSKHCLPIFQKRIENLSMPCEHIEIKDGESNKNLASATYIWEQLTAMKADRKSILLNLGGGVVTDIGGFAAANYKRGIRFVHIPTTLLSMVDAAIGGKCGIDFNGFKNHLGVFKQPEALLVEPLFLDTLPQKELESGAAEVFKHALISSKEGWDELKLFSSEHWKEEKVILASQQIKHEITKHDILEKGPRKQLNFGHTLGHAIESLMLHKGMPVTHGHAVAAGMLCESYLSVQYASLKMSEFKEIKQVLDHHYDKIEFQLDDIAQLMDFLGQDKKFFKGQMLLVLLKSIGEADWDVEIEAAEVAKVFRHYIEGKWTT